MLSNDALRILLVDDDEEEFFLLREMAVQIKRQRYELAWVDSMEKALKAFGGQEYDAYLIDYRLGSANGVDLIRELVKNRVNAPIILLTGQGNDEVDLMAQQAGAVDYLAKDQLSPSLLERSIRYSIEHKSIEAELERRVLERTLELQHSETRFRILAECTSAAIFIVSGTEIRYANPAAKTLTKFNHEELIEHSFLGLIHPDFKKPLDVRGLGDPWAPGRPSRYQLKIVRKDKFEKWVDLTVNRIDFEGREAWIVTAFEIPETHTRLPDETPGDQPTERTGDRLCQQTPGPDRSKKLHAPGQRTEKEKSGS